MTLAKVISLATINNRQVDNHCRRNWLK